MSDPPSAPDWSLERETQVRGLIRDRRRKLQLLASSRCPKGDCGGLLGSADDRAKALYQKLRKKKFISKGEFAHDIALAIQDGQQFTVRPTCERPSPVR
jgi:hypothetical protein